MPNITIASPEEGGQWWRGVPMAFAASAWTVTAVLAVTYLVSTTRGALAVRSKQSTGTGSAGTGPRPPMLPYMVPLLGHIPGFLWDIEKFLSNALARYGGDIPVRIRLLNRKMALLQGPKNVAALWKSSRDLSSERWLVQVLVNAFGVEPTDAPFYLSDDTGLATQPDPTSHGGVAPEHRIFHLVYKSVHEGLSGARLAEMERQLVGNLASQMAEVNITEEWTDIPDVYGSFIRSICFRASTISLCGTRIFEVIPTLEKDFWVFDGHLPNLFREVPRLLAPESYKARDVMKENMKRWHAFAHENYDVTEGAQDKREWEEFFGSRLMRWRQEFFRKMPLSKATLAADDLGLLWGATANAIPGIGWMILEVLQRPELLERVRQEIKPFITWNGPGQGQMVVDIEGLCRQTLLQSIYAEVLRLHNSTFISRVPKTPDFTIGGWHFRKNEPIMVSTYFTAREPSVWNQGTEDEPHPVTEFWAERFIVDPTKSLSGPVMNRVAGRQQGEKENDASGDSGPVFSMSGTDGSWIPYGGGSRMCPGRHFAKKELIVGMAMFLTSFDIELKTDPNTLIEDDMNYFMFGVMHPKGAIPARIRRRVA